VVETKQLSLFLTGHKFIKGQLTYRVALLLKGNYHIEWLCWIYIQLMRVLMFYQLFFLFLK